jgi:hypothetical protein
MIHAAHWVASLLFLILIGAAALFLLGYLLVKISSLARRLLSKVASPIEKDLKWYRTKEGKAALTYGITVMILIWIGLLIFYFLGVHLDWVLDHFPKFY